MPWSFLLYLFPLTILSLSIYIPSMLSLRSVNAVSGVVGHDDDFVTV